jgi:anti-sigma factor RsiW
VRCGEARSIGAYVLGALDLHERLAMERHLGVCSMCRQELIEVAHLPGLLHRLTLDDVIASRPRQT